MIVKSSEMLDQSKAAILHYRHLIDRIDDPKFELSSLSAVLHDPTSEKLLQQATTLHLEIEDESCHSEKEEGRNRRELSLQRKILKEHLEQLVAVEQLNGSLFQDKIMSLQKICLDCINRQISVGQEQISHLVRVRKESLIHEKQLLEKKMQDLRRKMNDLPDKWRAENLLKLKTELGIKIMQSITQLVESRTVGQNLHTVESKPLDYAVVPVNPKPPYLLLVTLAGALIGFLAALIGFFLKGLYQGFPAAPDTLQALRYPFSGSISFLADGPHIEHLPDNDLEALRKLQLMIDEPPSAQIVALFGNKGPDYAHALADLFAKSHRKPLLIRCDFSSQFSLQDTPGLLQVLQGGDRALPIVRIAQHDVLPSGGYTRFGLEIVRSSAFSELLQRCKASHDLILLYSRAPLNSAESAALLPLAEKAVVTLVEEPIELLTPWTQWAYHEGRCRLTFLTASISS